MASLIIFTASVQNILDRRSYLGACDGRVCKEKVCEMNIEIGFVGVPSFVSRGKRYGRHGAVSQY
jgi:hypothetical protein